MDLVQERPCAELNLHGLPLYICCTCMLAVVQGGEASTNVVTQIISISWLFLVLIDFGFYQLGYCMARS
jgi:hypothetical protein